MSARKVSPGEARARVTRRTVLTIGGLTIAAGYLMDPARQAAQARSPAETRSAIASSPPPEITAKAQVSQGTGRQGAGDAPMYYINDGPKAIALTVDDGPDPVYTPQVLKLLAKYQVTATFSMIGTEVGSYPGVVREVAAAGHMIANHTWTHVDLTHLKPVSVADQMNRTTDAIHAVTGTAPMLFRAPYGAWSPAVLRECATTGMTPLDWSVDPRDWARPGVSSIVRNIMRHTRTGSIILEHDGGGNRSQTVAALKIVLPRLLAAGYQFRTP
jgi:peptidoglycan-N-acetylglucosamine deacetylase